MNRIVLAAALVLLAACSREQPAATASEAASPSASGATASASATAAPQIESRYTSLRECKVIKANEEEDWSSSRCEALGGFSMILDYGDLREDLRLKPGGGSEVHIGIPGLGGGGFNSLGPSVEWRGKVAGGQFTPKALIVRDAVSYDPEDGDKTRSMLAVIDLAKPCLVALVPPGAEQNQRARDIADATTQACMPQGG